MLPDLLQRVLTVTFVNKLKLFKTHASAQAAAALRRSTAGLPRRDADQKCGDSRPYKGKATVSVRCCPFPQRLWAETSGTVSASERNSADRRWNSERSSFTLLLASLFPSSTSLPVIPFPVGVSGSQAPCSLCVTGDP
ncbi:hypothetical protein SKAU_G00337580 [Synaphobranchus kaupii]|uniref:Uncharacterized protein n=1 Tax=Synaphobranchus kaupii TaxID=118154 RepID=A0A9Q1EMI9_SYNKA|nr:hypothetical protein SKAU_G00337580 [Synaphobranchus kaupii]